MRNSILMLLIVAISSLAFAQNPATPYAVQLAAFNEPVSTDYFEGFEGVYFISVYGGTMFKYFTKNYSNKDKAMAVVAQAKKAGHANAVLVDMIMYAKRSQNCCSTQGNTVSVNNIFFDFDRSNLRQASKLELDNVVGILNKTPGYTVEVRAHTDAKGSNEYNQALSVRRRDAAVAYLKSKGISASRITATTHGESTPAAINQTPSGEDSPEGRQYNRRVELIVRDPQGGVKAANLDFVPANLKP